MAIPERKPNRLKDYDYSQNGAYFITVCVKDRKPILSRIIDENAESTEPAGESAARPENCPLISLPIIELSPLGFIVDRAIRAIPSHYPEAAVDRYVIMPNHIHMILLVSRGSGRAMLAPTNVSEVIRQMKGYATKQYGNAIWQKSYYDHIIRDEYDYRIKSRYIEENPARWREDEFYTVMSKGTGRSD